MPNPRYASRIEAQVREHRELWSTLHRNLPGLFLSRKPLSQLGPTDDGCVLIPFETNHPRAAALTIERVRGIANDRLSWDFAQQAPPKPRFFGKMLFNAIELKPGVFGFKIDLKKLSF